MEMLQTKAKQREANQSIEWLETAIGRNNNISQ
jgi:hypothetical protein